MKPACLWSLIVIAVALLAPVTAAAKPTVAVLGLEVLDDGSSVNATSTQFAKDLTEAMRAAPRSGRGPYMLAPGGSKDFVELKLLFGCDQENKDCLARIGGQVAADYIMYGSIAKRGASYVVTVKLFAVSDKSVERAFADSIPPEDMEGAALSRWGGRLYEQLTEAPGQDNAPSTVTTPSPDDTAVSAPPPAVVVTLPPPVASAKSRRPGKTARAMFFISLGVTAAAATGAVYYSLEIGKQETALRDAIFAYRDTPGNASAFPPAQNACVSLPSDAAAVARACADGDVAATRANVGWAVAGVAAVSTAIFGYVGFRKRGPVGESRPSATAWSIVPVLSPGARGAALTVTF
ncbi:MAG: hypothetical protein IPL79_11445 [Myxococcales bacterium]|nr:hypothetical protein [Myxococcales bacterium]